MCSGYMFFLLMHARHLHVQLTQSGKIEKDYTYG